MNLGVETSLYGRFPPLPRQFQHSLMNLGVETRGQRPRSFGRLAVSAFSDESWGGDLKTVNYNTQEKDVSAFSDESWGGDPDPDFRWMADTFVSAFSDESWGGDRQPYSAA